MNFGEPLLDLNDGKGHIAMFRPKPNVMVLAQGFLTVDLWLPQVALFEKAFHESPRLHLFRDVWEVRTVATEYREASEKFMKANVLGAPLIRAQ